MYYLAGEGKIQTKETRAPSGTPVLLSLCDLKIKNHDQT